MSNIDYDHSKNIHTLSGPRVALPVILGEIKPRSLLDVGCGIGTWLKAALESGITDVFGVDGIAVAPENFLVAKTLFRQQDLNQTWSLGRRFEVALCLEVAEHLDAQFAGNLIEALTLHADTVIFGAACPGQGGQHHVNCQWPVYWQKMFNERGYVCSDEIRWKIWQDERIEPWYRQNIFTARRDPAKAGHEPGILPVVHPDILKLMTQDEFSKNIDRIAEGALPFKWYWVSFPKVFLKKVAGKFK
jgi:SAM-dependent methyltransferase